MEFKLTKANIILLGTLVAFLVIATVLAFQGGGGSQSRGNVFVCGDQVARFRANISNCYNVSVSPGEKRISEVLTSPAVEKVYLLTDPNGTSGIGLSSYEIYKTMESLQPRSNIKPEVAYIRPWPNQSNILVLKPENATYSRPIIHLMPNQTETKIDLDGPVVEVRAKNQYDLDSAACRISILLIKEYMDCS